MIVSGGTAVRVSNIGINDPNVPMTDRNVIEYLNGFNGTSTASSVRVSETTSLGMPAVWRAVNLIASGIAALPLHAYKRDTNDPTVRVPQYTGQGADLLANPHPDLTPFELWEIVLSHLLLWGNAYLQKLRNRGGQIVELWPIHPSRVGVSRDKGDLTKRYRLNGYDEAFTDDQILHIPGFGYDGVCGMSPIAANRQGIGLALAAEEFGARLFGSGTLASGILTTDRKLGQESADVLKKRWAAKIGGLQNSHEIAVLDQGAKFQQLTIPPEDAQFIESRGFQIEEVARIYGVPPHMLMAVDKTTSWGSGVEQQTIAFVTYTLRPWLTRLEQRITRVLSPGGVYAHFALEGLLRGDSAQRAAYYQTLWNVGAFSTNDIRALEELAPVEGGDMRYRPLNMGQLGTADTANNTPAPAEEPANA